MSDPLWFLENLDENESKSDQNNFTLNYSPQQDLEKKEGLPNQITSFPEDGLQQVSTQTQGNAETRNVGDNQISDPNQTTKVFEVDLLKDEESLRTALQNSLMESIKNGQNPEIQITVNSKPENALLGDKLEDNNNRGDAASQKIVITLNKKENGQVVGEEKKYIINNSNNQKSEVDEVAGTNQRPTMYVILPTNQNNQSNTEPTQTGNNTNTQYCEEVGSTVINLNDLISSNENVTLNDGKITANVDLSSVIDSSDGVPKVKLVIKVNDERNKTDKKPIPEESVLLKSYSADEMARLRELLKSSATLESLDSQLQSGKEVRNIPITVTPSTSSQTSSTWQTTNYKSVSDTITSQQPSDPSIDWVDKSTDSYVRKDGAQCTRTVWNTPQGRRVETKCFKDERKIPRGRRARDLDWSPRFDSFWSIDEDIDRMFSYANRFFY